VTVFARFVPSGELGTRIELQVDPRDRLVRRRVCLTVVEYLRLLSSGEAPPEPPPDPPASRPAPPVRVEQLDGELAATAVLSEKAAGGVPVSPGRPWVMGVAATLDLDTALGESTGHLLFIWHFPVGPRLGVRALGFWPLFGAELQRGDEHVRLWTFGTAVGLQYAFVESPAVVRPFVGATLGMRLTLTETTTVATSANDATTFTPSANAGLQAGLAFQLSRVVQLFLESGATRDWRIPGVSASGVAASASNAFSLNSSIGAMFEY
jgi:hypothetical protein